MSRQHKRIGFLVIFIVTLIFSVAGQSHAQTYLPGAKFGVNDDFFHGFDFQDDDAAMLAAANGGMGIVRISVYWYQLQPLNPATVGWNASLDPNMWSYLEGKVNDARNHGVTVYATLSFPPQWATHVPAETSTCGGHLCGNADVPFYCYQNPAAECQGNHAPAEADVRNFVSYTVNRLKGRVKYWGFANEPADTTFWTGDGPNSPTRTTPGLVTTMLKAGYEEAKKADPGVTIVGPDEIATNNFCYLLQNASQYFDIISFHAYQDWNHETMEQRLDDMKGCIDAYGQPGKPVWLTEYNDITAASAPNGDNQAFQATRVGTMNDSILARPWINRALLYSLRGGDVGDPAARGFSIMVTPAQPKLAYSTESNYATTHYSPRVAIDTSLQSAYIADATGGPNYDDYIVVTNDSPGGSTTVRLTYVFPDGSGKTRDFAMGPHSRTTVRVPDEAGVGGQGPVSVAVQSLNPSVPVFAEHSTYWGPGYAGGRSSEGVAASPTWYFAEGNVASGGFPFYEYLTVFNPNPQPVDVTFTFLLLSGVPVTRTVRIFEGPGRVQIKVNDLMALGVTTHATTIYAVYVSNGAPAPVAAERSMYWGTDLRDGHSSPGVPAPLTTWYSGEGAQGGAYLTYIPISNPSATPANVSVTFYNETGAQSTSAGSIPAFSRATFTAPNGFGGWGFTVTSDVAVAAEHVIYWDADGVTWAGGTAGVLSPSLATHWVAPEGEMNSFFHTWVLIGNPGGSTASVRVAFMRPDGSFVPIMISIPPHTRYTLDTNLYISGEFSSDVISTVPVVVERSMYWAGSDFYGGTNTLARIVNDGQ